MNGKKARQIRRFAYRMALQEQMRLNRRWAGARWFIRFWRWVKGEHCPRIRARTFYRRCKKLYTEG